MNDRFHKAAKDGYEDLLKQATKKDLNQRDDSGMTPTLWAAYHGNLDALRLCCSRGGDPDKCDYVGNTALHFASANGYKNCLMFLVSFGANVWQMDNDYHTIMDVAAIREKHDCIKYLDGVITKQKSLDKKKVATLQARAKKDAEKRIKVYEKMQLDLQKRLHKIHQAEEPVTVVDGGGRKKKISVISMQPSTFSEVTSIKPPAQRKISRQMNAVVLNDGFRVSEDGRRTVNSFTGVPSNVQSDVLFQRPETMSSMKSQDQDASKRKMLRNVFQERQLSGPEDPAGGNERSVFGTMALRTTFGLANTMNSAAMDAEIRESDSARELSMIGFDGAGIGGGFSSLPTGVDDNGSDDDEEFMNRLVEPSELETFLASLDLSDFSKIFKEQKVDMEVLKTCSEQDLKELGLVMGPRKKILNALSERKQAIELTAEMELTEF